MSLLNKKLAALKDAEAFVRDIQGGTTGEYTVVYPWSLDDLRNARRYVRILKRDIRKIEDSQLNFIVNTCDDLLNK
jgi:hypothetical protein